ncbi:MAG: gamma-glutamyl-gamma-aminobutyrate hydrolase family protein [Oscillospiraceae bacterium]|jgi:putative glutamine amidotransferase|nr:gamma-glutamyl-gamma-aminobutyrate hydrolase family protein [Oscillospiraceae bacterium]
MRFLLTGGTLNPLKGDYLAALARYGHTGTVVYPGQPYPDVNGYDALLLPGGADIEPARFGAPLLKNGSETLDTERDKLEFAVFADFFRLGKPIFGICRGLQVINVALGGTIWQDLPSQCGLCHVSADGEPPMTHKIRWAGRTEMDVNSYHHQAVRDPGKGLAVTARAADGVIEAIEHKTHPVIAVQWHPEKGGAYEAFDRFFRLDTAGMAAPVPSV